MIQNYLKIAWRNILRNKGYATINIIGLAIGLACCLLVVIYIQNELSYDRYHVNKDRIYRVIHDHKEVGSTEQHQVWGNAPIGAALKSDFPEIEKVVQFSGQVSILFKQGENTFQEERVFFMDATAFDVFSWKVLMGDVTSALEKAYSVVLTESTARKYFGNQNPIGKTIEGGLAAGRAEAGLYTVTAVIADVPTNSHFTFDALLSMSTFRKARPSVFEQEGWGYVDFYTYFLASKQFDIARFQHKIPDFLKRHHITDGKYNFHIEPFLAAYMHSPADRQPGILGNYQNLYIFAIIGGFILLIACVNFMNLATSRSMERAKEVGIRKTIGANKSDLIVQFMSESLALVFIGALLAIILVIISLPFMEAFSGKYFTYTALLNSNTWAIFVLVTILTGILAACYPALILANLKPIKVLKGTFSNAKGGIFLRRGLVVFQFFLSISLIAGTVIVFSQLNQLQQQDLGFQKAQRLVIDYNFDQNVSNNLEAIKTTLSKDRDVLSVTASRTVPGTFFPNAGTEIMSTDGKMTLFAPSLFEVDIDFIPNMGIKMAAGRPYSRDFPADTAHSLVINESAARLWGYSNPQDIIGKQFRQWGKEGTVIGVVKDFNYLSLHRKIDPLALRLEPNSSRYLTINIQNMNHPETITRIAKLWAELVPTRPFLYSFLDDNFNRQYEADYNFRRLFAAFSGLALFIACLGLLGLVTYTAQQRTKEIGVRKVLGASVYNLVMLLSSDFIKLLIVSLCIATPISWITMNKWLDNFAYHIAPKWWMFVFAGIVVICIALITVSFQTFKAAKANPVDSLRNE
ncbi:ABC transporter permease [Sphingobacterium sp. SYP-B4668]|uniref:ABC transporter permease n=1 Tax=Sphingobacterium sp. SYP-B4668 TaxID=2996035 RepID=UPI0022DE85C5|nr:ABC transporter permease [Sphingobacterium sp. SYP-B4668]